MVYTDHSPAVANQTPNHNSGCNIYLVEYK
jgi:hypothetical protein